MARPSMAGLTISKLENMLNQQLLKKKELQRERARLQKQLDKLDRQISGLDGGSGSVAGGTRSRNEKSLVATLEDVLAKHPKGMAVGDIVDAVLASGYKSSSPNFRGIVNQTLIKEKKAFAAVERGIYGLKK